MKVFLLKDVEKLGIAGEVIKVNEGYARNFLIPRKFGVEVTPENEQSFLKKVKMIENRKEVVASKTSMLAEKIKSLEITLKRKIHDGDKLYGAISQQEVADILVEKGIPVSKSQIIFDKSIKTKGAHTVTVKLSSKLQPQFQLKISPDA